MSEGRSRICAVASVEKGWGIWGGGVLIVALLLIFFERHLVGIDGFFGLTTGYSGAATVHVGANHLLGWVHLHHLLQGKLHGGVGGEAGFEGAVVDVHGVHLLAEPCVEPHGADALDVTGTGAVGEAVEDLQDLLVVSEGGEGMGGGGLRRGGVEHGVAGWGGLSGLRRARHLGEEPGWKCQLCG